MKLGPYIPDATAVILAGGENSRMGTAKSFVEIDGETILSRQLKALSELFNVTLIIARDPVAYRLPGVVTVMDDVRFGASRGPLLGLYSGLNAVVNGWAFVIACDMPFISPALVRRMAEMRTGFDAVITTRDGFPEPLFGFYSRTVSAAAGGMLVKGDGRLRDLLGRISVGYLEEDEARIYDPGLLSLMNLNTPGELEKAAGIFGRRPKH